VTCLCLRQLCDAVQPRARDRAGEGVSGSSESRGILAGVDHQPSMGSCSTQKAIGRDVDSIAAGLTVHLGEMLPPSVEAA